MTKKIKIAHVITRLIIGGAQENTLATVIGLMNDSNYDLTLITGPGLGPEGSLVNKAIETKVHMIVLLFLRRAINPIYDGIVFFQLWWIFRRNKFDIIHTHSSKAGILGRLAAYCAKTPIIIHTIHGLPFHPYQNIWKNKLFILLEKMCARISDKIITVSDTMRDKALDVGVGRENIFRTVYSGMALESFVTAQRYRYDARRKLGIKDTDIIVGKIARLFYLKGHDFILACASDIIRQMPTVKFLFVGDGVLKDKFKRSIHSLGLDSYFIFTGLVAPAIIPSMVACMDILVHTSLREGLARALPQAMAAALPVVTLDIDSSHEIVKNGINGYLINPNDKASFINAVVTLARKPELRKTMGIAGRKYVIPQFREDYMVTQIDSLYQELLSCG